MSAHTMLGVEQTWAALDSHEREDLTALAARPGPRVGAALTRLENDGLVQLLKETRRGTTWYCVTPRGRAVLAFGREMEITQSGEGRGW